MPITDAESFFSLLEKSRLLSPPQFAEAQEAAGDDMQAIVKSLVSDGRLTRWQAQQLIAGRHSFFLGKYKLLDKLGEGGMGAVYKAVQATTGRLVALKVMSEKVVKQPGAVSRFHREIRAVSALEHPSIVAALDADQVGETHFLVMEYAEGRDLKEWIKEFGRLPIDWSCECIRQSALGLQHAHERGLAHRDIKPSNILVVSGDAGGIPQVKILDMGLARFTSETQCTVLTVTGQVLGTIDYISPEQAKDTRGAGIQADIFSLGASLYHMLCGQVPFTGRNPMEKLMARAMRDAPRASVLRPDIPAELDAIIARMLCRKVEDRFQTPIEVVHALAPFCLGAPAECTPHAPREEHSLAPSVGSTIKAQADTTLNRFLNPRGVEPASEPTREREVPARPTSLLGLPVKWIAVAAGVLLLLGIGIVWSVSGGKPQVAIQKAPPKALPATPLKNTPVVNRPVPLVPPAPPVPPIPLTPTPEPVLVIRAIGWFWSVVFSPDGKDLLTTSGGVDTVEVRDPGTGKVKSTIKTGGGSPLSAGFSPDGKTIFTTGFKGSALLWQAEDRKLLRTLGGHSDRVFMAFSPDSKVIATSGWDGKLKLWNVGAAKPHAEFEGHGTVNAVAFSADGKWLARGSTGKVDAVKLFSAETGAPVAVLTTTQETNVHGLAFSPDSRLLITCGVKSARVWGVATRNPTAELPGHAVQVHHCAFTQDGKLASTCDFAGVVKLWNADDWTEAGSFKAHDKWVLSVAFSPDGKLLATGSNDGTAKIWRVADLLRPAHVPDGTARLPGPQPPPAVAPFDAAQARSHQEAWARHLATTVETTNSVGAKMVLIPPGEFLMGTPLAVVERLKEAHKGDVWFVERVPHEVPEHQVRITRPFYLGKYEVTQGEYEQVMGTNPSNFKGEGLRASVENVSWHDAVAYCNQLSEREELPPYYRIDPASAQNVTVAGGAGYRLPTEAEWEYTCRAGTVTQWSCGDDAARVRDFGWFNETAGGKTHPVGEKQANPFGLHDLHGNVWEWVGDWHGNYDGAPGNDPMGPASGSLRIQRGGSWYNSALYGRSAIRSWLPPATRHNFLGFRLALSPPVDGKEMVTEKGQPGVSARYPPVDLLKLIEPKRDAVQGEWKFEGEKLVTPDNDRTRLMVQYRPPVEYDLKVMVERKFGNNGFYLGVVVDGRQVIVALDAWSGTVCGLFLLDNHDCNANETTTPGGVLPLDRPVAVTCEVRKSGILVRIGESKLFDWKGNSARFSLDSRWKVQDESVVFLGSFGSHFHIHSYTVTPLSGPGVILSPGAAVDNAFLKQVAGQPPQEQLRLVVEKLKEINPGFTGKVATGLSEDKTIVQHFLVRSEPAVKDLWPVIALPGLMTLHLENTSVSDLTPLASCSNLIVLSVNYSPVSSLAPLRGMKLTMLGCGRTLVSDLSPLAGMPLTGLNCTAAKISDLAPLAGMPLTDLFCDLTAVASLEPLRGMKLVRLGCESTKVSDLSPLAGMPLVELTCDEPLARKHAELLKSLPTLKTINKIPVEEFWK